jgi:hypothetical protein
MQPASPVFVSILHRRWNFSLSRAPPFPHLFESRPCAQGVHRPDSMILAYQVQIRSRLKTPLVATNEAVIARSAGSNKDTDRASGLFRQD